MILRFKFLEVLRTPGYICYKWTPFIFKVQKFSTLLMIKQIKKGWNMIKINFEIFSNYFLTYLELEIFSFEFRIFF